MKKCGVALAVFVKTPGRSPIKTRLADGLGCERALAFYQLSVAAVEATVAAAVESAGVVACWAVAEDAGLADPCWQRFPRIVQGPGGLGERLGRVFGELERRHDAVIAIGADSPQITPALIGRACDALRHDGGRAAHVLGRCHDGGFYLVGTNHRIPAGTWRDLPYSTPDVAARLAAKFAAVGPITELPQLADVDRADDLAALRDELHAIGEPSVEQQAVLDWLVAASNDR